jgi:hypothetical protein
MILLLAEIECRAKSAEGKVRPPSIAACARTYDMTNSFRPMPGFDPSEPAILHDRLTDTTQTWTGENAADFRRNSRTLADGGIAWRGFEFDGWGNVLGG